MTRCGGLLGLHPLTRTWEMVTVPRGQWHDRRGNPMPGETNSFAGCNAPHPKALAPRLCSLLQSPGSALSPWPLGNLLIQAASNTYVRVVVVGNTKEDNVRRSSKEPGNYPKTPVSISGVKSEPLDSLRDVAVLTPKGGRHV